MNQITRAIDFRQIFLLVCEFEGYFAVHLQHLLENARTPVVKLHFLDFFFKHCTAMMNLSLW